MKKRFIVITFCSFLLVGCNSELASEDKRVNSSASFVKEKRKEVTKLKNELNNTEYSLSKSELDDFMAEGMITQEDYEELLLLTSNHNSN